LASSLDSIADFLLVVLIYGAFIGFCLVKPKEETAQNQPVDTLLPQTHLTPLEAQVSEEDKNTWIYNREVEEKMSPEDEAPTHIDIKC